MLLNSTSSETTKRCNESNDVFLVQLIHHSESFDFLLPMFSNILAVRLLYDFLHSKLFSICWFLFNVSNCSQQLSKRTYGDYVITMYLVL